MENYVLQSQIGEGSFGRVFKARRKFTGRMVAIKMISKMDRTQEDLISFKREISILRKMDHPNIMHLLDIFETDTDFCVVSELGRSDLFQIIEDNQKLPEEAIRTITAQLVSALNYLHNRQIIHRDMKPQNVLITAGGSVKLCDFGFARALSRTTLALNSIKGTPLYMAPELVQEHSYQEGIDVWSLGIILFELYYGKPPFFTDSIYKLIQMVVHDPITWPGPISEEFKSFLSSALQKNPNSRASCEQLMNHPFISSVKLSNYDDKDYQMKSKEFEDALNSEQFRPPTARSPDYQGIFMNPSEQSNDSLLDALQYLGQIENYTKSPFSVSFSSHLCDFILREPVCQLATKMALGLIEEDSKFRSLMLPSVLKILISDKMSPNALSVLIELLVIPFVELLIESQTITEPFELNPDEAQQICDKLFSFLFSADSTIVSNSYVLMNYLSSQIPVFFDTILKQYQQILPLLSVTTIKSNNFVIKAASLSLITKIVCSKEETFKSIQPISEFITYILNTIIQDATSIEQFCIISNSIDFVARCLPFLSSNQDFQARVTNISARKEISLMISYLYGNETSLELFIKGIIDFGSHSPRTNDQFLCYSTLQSSPFVHIPLQDFFIELFIEKIPYILPCHQNPLLNSLLRLPSEIVINHLPSMISIFPISTCSDLLCSTICDFFERKNDLVLLTIEPLCFRGIIPTLCGIISSNGNEVFDSVVLVLVQIIVSFSAPSKHLKDECANIVSSMSKIDRISEAAIVVFIHLARISSEYTQIMIDNGILNYVERAISSTYSHIKLRTIRLIGHLIKSGAVSAEFINRITCVLIDNLSLNDVSIKAALAFAIGNAIYFINDLSFIVPTTLDLLQDMVSINDDVLVLNLIFLFGNIVRKNDYHLSHLLSNGVFGFIVDRFISSTDVSEKIIPVLTIFGQYDEPRRIMREKGIVKHFIKNQSFMNESNRNAIQSLIHCLEE